MAIALSITISLLAGITVMYNNKYFWGKEDNQNINTINNTLTSFDSFTNISIVITVVIVVLAVVLLFCTRMGF